RLRYLVPMKAEGDIKTIEIEREGPVVFLVTTTRNKLNPENETRMLSLEVNDSADQTAAVMRKVAKVEGVANLAPAEFQVWHAYQRWLAPASVGSPSRSRWRWRTSFRRSRCACVAISANYCEPSKLMLCCSGSTVPWTTRVASWRQSRRTML